MSTEAVEWVLRGSAGDVETCQPVEGGRHVGRASVLLVLLVLAEHASPLGRNAYPSQRTISSECGVDRRGVREALAILVGLGLIAEQTDAPKSRRTKTYSLALPPREIPPPREISTQGDDGRGDGRGDGRDISLQTRTESEPTPLPPVEGFTAAAITDEAAKIQTQAAIDNGTDVRNRKAFTDDQRKQIVERAGDTLQRLADRSARCGSAGQTLTLAPFALAAIGQSTLLERQHPDPADCTTECICDGTGHVEPEPGQGWVPCPARAERLRGGA